MPLETQEYALLADRCLDRVVSWLEGFDPDELDFSASDGVVQFEFADGMRFVLNRQAGANQMWFAAVDRAWHYDWSAEHERWSDDRDGHDLFENIQRAVAEKLGRTLSFEPD